MNVLTHEEMIGLQAEKHELIDAHNFRSEEEYVLHLIHSFAYVQAAIFSEGKTVLDLGCNTGYGTEILSRSAKRVVGVDVSKEAISAASRQYSDLGIEFQLIDGEQLPFDDGQFDLIISCQIIEHIVDYNVCLNELKRVLSPTGIAVFTTPNALLRLDPGMKPWNRFHVREFDHSELKMLLEKHFASVQIMGLFAEESLYLIEKNRLSRARERAREAARIDQQSVRYYQLRSIIKRMTPSRALNKLKKYISHSKNILATALHPKIEIDKAFTERHGLRDLFYRIDKLNIALDLLAICSNDVSVPKGIMKKLKMV
jgi:2-polyprenyl-3-methyl-5-hydroxy-6-metoxy-1,4-benzoquinol methylase